MSTANSGRHIVAIWSRYQPIGQSMCQTRLSTSQCMVFRSQPTLRFQWRWVKTNSTDADFSARTSRYWWKNLTTIQQVVPNSGSIARDILAAERTFLAWSRTGLGFVGAGSALFAAYHQDKVGERNFPRGHENPTEPTTESVIANLHLYPTLAASLLVGNGAFLLIFATRRYLRTVALMTLKQEPALFPIDTKGTLTAVAVTACSSVASLGLVLSTTMQQTPSSLSNRAEEKG